MGAPRHLSRGSIPVKEVRMALMLLWRRLSVRCSCIVSQGRGESVKVVWSAWPRCSTLSHWPRVRKEKEIARPR